MARLLRVSSGLLQGLDVFDDARDLVVGELLDGHRGWESLDDFRVRVDDRLADVVFVDDDATAALERLGLAPQALPARADERPAVGRVTGVAALAAEHHLAELHRRQRL